MPLLPMLYETVVSDYILNLQNYLCFLEYYSINQHLLIGNRFLLFPLVHNALVEFVNLP